MKGQTAMFESANVTGCTDCICRDCLMWWSSRCPYGECHDDYRALVNPYDKAHPDKPPRTGWTNWRKDQAYWCRGGVTYPVHCCDSYVHYDGCTVKRCLLANVQLFQDGYIGCSIVDSVGCSECYRRWEEENT